MKLVKAWYAGVLLLLLLIPGQAGAQIKGSSMGGLNAVVSDGPFDASRNPALLFFQKETGTVGAFVRYRAYDDTDITFRNAPGQVDESIDTTLVGGGGIAYSSRLGSTVLGFSFGDAGGDFYNSSTSKSSLLLSSGTVIQRDDMDNREINPTLALSLALAVSDHSSIGFQILTGYSQNDSFTSRDIFYISSLSEKLKIDHTTRSIEFTAGFGYLYATPDSQVGLLIRSGTGMLQQQQMDLRYTDIADGATDGLGSGSLITDNSFKRTRLTPFQWIYPNGMNITLGGYKRLSPLLAFALESVYVISNSYSSEDFKLQDDIANDSYTVKNITSNTTTSDSMTFKGGVEVNLSQSLLVTAGLGYGYFRSVSGSKDESTSTTTRSEYDLYYATLGCHYSLSRSSVISLITNAAKITSKADLKQSSFSLSLKQDLFFLDAGLAVTTAF